jgi:hypothetical protein
MAPPWLLAAISHVAGDEEGVAAEHLLLSQIRSVGDEPPDTIGELVIVGHAGEPTQRCGDGAGPGGAAGCEWRTHSRLADLIGDYRAPTRSSQPWVRVHAAPSVPVR